MPLGFADAIFWIAVACCTVAQGAIVASPLRSRGRLDPQREPEGEVPWPRRAGEIAWAIVPGIGLTAAPLRTWRAIPQP